MGLQFVQLRCRSATRWPTDARLDAIAGDASKPGKRHRHCAKQRRDAMAPPVLQMAFSAAGRAARPLQPVAVGLRGNDRSLNTRQKLLRFGQASIPGQQYRQDLPAGRSLSDRCSGSGHHPPSQSTATPIASPFPRSAIDPTDRTACAAIPQSLDTPVFQNTDGSVALWDMNGTSVIGGGLVASDPGPTWHIKGMGDFFGDGNTDIVLQNDDGSVAVWDMNGTSVIGGGLVAADPGPTWHIKGTGDFFGDGNTDIVLQNDDGSVALWDMNGTNIVGGGEVANNPGTSWNVLDNIMQFIYSASANETLTATPMTPDEFVFISFAAGSHTIDGFNPLQDMIEFSKAQFASFSDVQAATSAVSGGAMINLGNGSSLLLAGINPASLHTSDFALA